MSKSVLDTAALRSSKKLPLPTPHDEEPPTVVSTTSASYYVIARHVNAVLSSRIVIVATLALTLVALFMDDIRLSVTPISCDYAFDIVTTIIFALFACELVIAAVFRADYAFSFFFWLDAVFLLSLLPEISFIWNSIVHSQNLNDTRATIAVTRLTMRAAAVIRFVRMTRVVRIAKLFELFARSQHHEGIISAKSDTKRTSQVGQHLSEQTTRKVVLLVLLMLFGIPLLQPQPTNRAQQYVVNQLDTLSRSEYVDNNGWKKETDFVLSYNPAIIYANVNSSDAGGKSFHYVSPDFDSYRTIEVVSVSSGSATCIFSVRSESQLTAEYNILTTILVLILLAVGAVLFNRNNHRMVIVPIERMMATIVALQENPLAKATHYGTTQTAERQQTLMSQTDGTALTASPQTNTASDHNNETVMLERTLDKLTALLRVGFGEAGHKMIQKCMQLTADGDLNPLVDGTKMLAVFGFCDIRRFTDATECLKEDVMMYVNEIAAIVHEQVSQCDGSPNKNIGDAFLLVWRMPSEMDTDDIAAFVRENGDVNAIADDVSTVALLAEKRMSERRSTVLLSPRHGSVTANAVTALFRPYQPVASPPATPKATSPRISLLTKELKEKISAIADKALISFVRVIIEIASSDKLKRYAQNPRIKAAFESFEVQLGFGLHVGWAIEGPIGSRYKIDASYLSPHVNLAETLEGTTKLYGVPLLMSGEFYSLLSASCRPFCRLLDVVKVGGREKPMALYTFDICQRDIESLIRNTKELAPVPTPIRLASHDDIKQRLEHTVREEDDEEMHDDDEKSSLIPSSEGQFHRTLSLPGEVPSNDDQHDDKKQNIAPITRQATTPLPSISSVSPSLSSASRPTSPPPLISLPPLPHNPTAPSAMRRLALSNRVSAQLPYHLIHDSHMSVLQSHIPPLFFDYFSTGMSAYQSGDWKQSVLMLSAARSLYPTDRCCTLLIDFMTAQQEKAPDGWKGCREL